MTEANQTPPADEGPVQCPVGRLVPERAAVGDVVACNVRHPYPQVLRIKLETQAAADKATELLRIEPRVWWLEKRL